MYKEAAKICFKNKLQHFTAVNVRLSHKMSWTKRVSVKMSPKAI